MIVFFIIILLILFISYLAPNKSKLTNYCPQDSSKEVTDIKTNVEGCYCPINYAWDEDFNKCFKCPDNSNHIVSDRHTSKVGCYCITGYIFDGQYCIRDCTGNMMRSTDKTKIYYYDDCTCKDVNYGFDLNDCSRCPNGSTNNFSEVNTILEGCYCNTGTGYDYMRNVCTTCHTNSSSTGTSLTNLLGCYCDGDYVWNKNNSTCQICPTGSVRILDADLSSTNPTPIHSGCYCPDGSEFDTKTNKCIKCPYNTSVNNKGGESNVVGCFCETGSSFKSNVCIKDVLMDKNIPHYIHKYDANANTEDDVQDWKEINYCPTDYTYDDVTQTCQLSCRGQPGCTYCDSKLNLTNITPTVNPTLKLSDKPNCYCVDGYIFDIESGECVVECGVNMTRDKPLHNISKAKTDIEGCYCITGYSFINNKCVKNCNYRNMININDDTCGCKPGYSLINDSLCGKNCTTGMTYVNTNIKTYIDDCYCLEGYEYITDSNNINYGNCIKKCNDPNMNGDMYGNCRCKVGYDLIDGRCIKNCPEGMTYYNTNMPSSITGCYLLPS